MMEILHERMPLSIRGRQILFLCVFALCLFLVFAFVDLSPTVDKHFFFASGKGTYRWEAWVEARKDLWRATVGSSFVVTVGFSLLMLSAFPPTRRLGLSVALGTIISLALVLFVFPRLAATFERKK